MSFLREAEKCLLNQKTFASLNAFITPLERSATWREQAQAADHRHGKGEINTSLYFYRSFTANLN